MDDKELIAQLTAENEKLKSANDALSKENADKKRQLQERMTEDERRKAAEQEEKQRTDALLTQLRRYELAEQWGKTIDNREVLSNVVDKIIKGEIEQVPLIVKEYMDNREKAILEKKKKDDIGKDQTPPPAGGANVKTLAEYVKSAEGLRELQELATNNPERYASIIGSK